jgi:integrase/recombinase XerC
MEHTDLRHVLDVFLGQYDNERTRKAYAESLIPLVEAVGGGRPIAHVTSLDLQTYAARLRKRGYAPATVNKHIKATKVLFNWAVKSGLIAGSPAAAVKTSRPPKSVGRDRAMHDDELEKILEYSKHVTPRTHALILFLADTGCRAGGAANLRVGHLDLAARRAVVTEKGNKTRPVFYGEVCANAIRRWLVMRGIDDASSYVFGMKGEKSSPVALSQAVRRACKLMGIRSLGSHSLRHRKGHQLADERVAPTVAALVLGHENVNTTMVSYYPQDYARAEEAVRALTVGAMVASPDTALQVVRKQRVD